MLFMDEFGLNSFDLFSPIRPMSICMGYWCAHLEGMEMLKSRRVQQPITPFHLGGVSL